MATDPDQLVRLVEQLRFVLTEIDACASTAEELFSTIPIRDRHYRRQRDHIAHFLAYAVEATTEALATIDRELSGSSKRRRADLL